MALAKEFMGGSVIERSSFISSSSSSRVFLNHSFQQKRNQSFFSPGLENRRAVHLRKAVRSPVAAISEDLVKKTIPSVPAEKPVKFKVRAVVTVRNKNKEALKEQLVKHLDAFTDKIGRNVVLELVSSEIDPSKPPFFFLSLCVRNNGDYANGLEKVCIFFWIFVNLCWSC